jgi:hypothetical protein
MNFIEAEQELNRKRALHDGKDYCIIMSYEGDYRVGEKTAYHYMIDSQDKKLANTRLTDIEFI